MAERERPEAGREEAEGFLRRWSRRKAEARSGAADRNDEASDPEAAAAPLPQAPEPEAGEPAPIDPKDLPDIESLDASSDYTVFMRPGVPAHLRTLALRKLWRSDPIFSHLDGLLEYGEDYSIPSWPKGTVKTAYQIGRGFVSELEKLEAAAALPGPEGSAPGTAVAPAPQESAPETAATSAEDSGDAPSASPSSAPEEAKLASPGQRAGQAASAPVNADAPATVGVPAKPRRRPLPRRG